MFVIAGDIGGTKTTLGIFSSEKGGKKPLIEKTFQSRQYPDFESILQTFLQSCDMDADRRAVFGVAGPSIDGRVSVTNLPWTIDERRLKALFKIPFLALINDLEALGYALPLLGSTDLFTLNKGRIDPLGNMAVVAPGTGLGELILTRDEPGAKKGLKPHASEGGHCDFAPANPLQLRLLEYLWSRFGHVSYERVCSGSGIPNIYDFLKNGEGMEEPEWLARVLSGADDPTPVIINAAMNNNLDCRICRATLDCFISILGAEAGNLALKAKATGGIYLGGGIPPRLLPALKGGLFMEAFTQKTSMKYLLEKIPVHVILNPNGALLGAAAYGFF
jgi:glucokinase